MYPTKLSEKERTDNSRIIAISKTLNNKSKTRKLVLAVQTVQTRKNVAGMGVLLSDDICMKLSLTLCFVAN